MIVLVYCLLGLPFVLGICLFWTAKGKDEIPFRRGWASFFRCNYCGGLESDGSFCEKKPKLYGIVRMGETCNSCGRTTLKSYEWHPAGYLLVRGEGENL